MSLNNQKIIKLDKMLKEGSKILSGRDEGKIARQKANLDQLDTSNNIINIEISEKIYSINPSFFLGMFSLSYQKLGEDKFREKYKFICNNIIRRNIEEGIARAKKEFDK
ncbi:hypothetical protein [Niameybacter massiliensis]|uniref:hypothetical protein n=1 Tax=Niameybacter massiliensis TaxID=1658108 RepID=UPI0006B64B15|nr:hypothetical protein [Niameybacter massiliensis]